MKTKFKVLSHACATVETSEAKLIMDPWLIGSCYWRSWWNYPPVKKEELSNLKVDAVYITHVHWDHWHGPTLKKLFPKDTLIITHEEPNGRSVRDLKDIGFGNIKLLKHGESFKIKDITITPYQFGLFLNDSALVIETSDSKILNANDCKIAGTALKQILNKHGQFDLALRSHSSANDRICYSIEGNFDYKSDDELHYSKSFAYFMNAVKPKYAIPFASNHCHLHKDVYSLNPVVNDPFRLKKYLTDNDLLEFSELKILLSGDSWESQRGFQIDTENVKYFSDKEKYIQEYYSKVSDQLESFYELENKQRITKFVIERFKSQIESIPKFFRNKLGDFQYKMILFNDKKATHFIVNPKKAKISQCDESTDLGATVKIPVKIFIDAVAMNMFHHSSISKRNTYIFGSEELLVKYAKFQDLLELVELEVFPIRLKYIINLIRSYTRRWRELFVYTKALFYKSKGLEIYQIEEEILKQS